MSRGEIKSASLETTTALIYQTLVGLNQCYEMKRGEAIWFEKDGDVSLRGLQPYRSMQTEVKLYSSPLTDHHENFWKTLKNWLSEEFDHAKYASLVLHTNQKFGVNSTLNDWNSKDTDERMKIVEDIVKTREKDELDNAKAGSVASFQKTVINTDPKKLSIVLNKVYITSEADDLEILLENIKKNFRGIPVANHKAYLYGLVGFIFTSVADDSDCWSITEESFRHQLNELTAIYHLKEFTFPVFSFSGNEANDTDVATYSEKPFVEKIKDIDYDEAIPEAIGNWLELHHSLKEDLDNYPQYKDKTNEYQMQLVSDYKRDYRYKKRNSTDSTIDSQNLYDETIGKTPPPMLGFPNPPKAYKNGLIHRAMDEDVELKWRID